MQNSEIPEVDLLEACGAVTAESVRGWFQHSGFYFPRKCVITIHLTFMKYGLAFFGSLVATHLQRKRIY
jgi:hypothetical protein